ncbi:MAG: carboxypeptidase M32 [Paracoccaceae bacterium]
MPNHVAYSALLDHLKRIEALSQAAGILSWDQETMMPPGGGEARAEQLGALEASLHGLKTDPRLGDWIAAIGPDSPGPAGQANVRKARRMFDRATRIPVDLAEEIARAAAQGQQIWAQAREANRFADFAAILKTIVGLRRAEAECLTDGGELYDALLDDYEPGMTVAVLAPLLESMRPRLTELRAAIDAAGPPPARLTGAFGHEEQLALARVIGGRFGYDWQRGRLDLSTHPFSSGTLDDVRITTRVFDDDPLGCIYSTIHEVGHALYEQGLPRDGAFAPAGRSVSMGVHESQSRLMENQIGRSRAFCDWLYPEMTAIFGDIGVSGPGELYAAVNRVETGFIRTEADEVHYNLHILLRLEIERDLIAGALDVADIEEVWNTRFERDFGRAVPDARNGVLQDVHWSVGLFGYFPTYALGNIFAGCLHARMRADLPDLDDHLARGDLSPAGNWLHGRIHGKGSVLEPMDLVAEAAGGAVSAEPLLGYLEAKFTGLYGL